MEGPAEGAEEGEVEEEEDEEEEEERTCRLTEVTLAKRACQVRSAEGGESGILGHKRRAQQR
jgi:hypothetical protein